ncbi:SDR family NAD(P)-dependent oxidoreductase [Arthrobacter sp. SLBN-53]|uniref:SDR family NAD(P)-dependent oxidoreductase n=1 Tax=Arthrobacter sp. SLBN-53 TaxID=2768412 RepID=UPI00115440AB|nr:SDR family NAD(P)-dependent oxidoreductase [Arthrobacter sp. SLBN-53]TQK28357.1 NADP-dependent 3-hydroxy acid dehydrogenase YdfG [Arthrobacter sp. SLBN-53]
MHVVNVDGRTVRALTAGDRADTPLLLLHGIGRSLEDWTEQIERLSGRFYVIAIDLPGFGRSARRDGPADLATVADGVAGALAALDEDRPCHVVGNSLGGAVAMQLLASHPDRVASLTLVNSAGFGAEVTALLRMLSLPGIGRYLATRSTPAGARLMERQLFADPSLATRERIDHALSIAAQPGTGEFLLEMANHLGTMRGVRPQWRTQLLATVAAHPRPTLLIWGDRDRILPAAHLAAARRQFPDAQVHLFTETGHMPQIERADEFADLVTAFVANGPTLSGSVPPVTAKVGHNRIDSRSQRSACMEGFAGKVAVVTGAGSGIGQALAVELGRSGAKLAISDVDTEGLAVTEERLKAIGAPVKADRLDVTEREAFELYADAVKEHFGKVNQIYNNAGIAYQGDIEVSSFKDIERVMDVDFWGVVNGTKAFLPHLIASGDGHVVNVSSVFGLFAVPGQAAYNSAKFAVRGFTEALRQEMAINKHPVQVTCVHPGGIKTAIARNATAAEGIDVAEMAKAFDTKLARTSPEKAAQIILEAVRKDRARVLVGADAKILDVLIRITGSGGYQKLFSSVAKGLIPK